MSAFRQMLERMQPLGRALMLPIAVLPVAGLLLRLGQADLLNLPFIAAAGSAIFGHLGILFAIGVGVGLARENHGAAGLGGAVAFVVLVEGAKILLAVPPDIGAGLADGARETMIAAWKDKELAKLGVPAGILSGLVAGAIFNRYGNIKLPDYLAFFGGRRFVPIASGLAGLGGAVLFGIGFPALEAAIDGLSHAVVSSGEAGLFAYGVLNRVLIVTGLHHVLNNIAWFILGDFNGATGDLNRFFAGDPTAGAFMAGFFPVMMFGLPAACLAMYRAARPERRKEVGGLFLSLGLTSFLTGVTEPIEFSFMFLAPLLYAVHVVLTGAAMVVMDVLQIKLGFGFSAGLFDYVLNFRLATRPLLLLPVGAAYFAIYYAAFSFVIRRFDLKTPGRDAGTVDKGAAAAGDEAGAFVAALGGAANLREVGACTTRLRLQVARTDMLDEAALGALGARGVLKVSDHAVQVVVGPRADQLASEIRGALDLGSAPSPAPVTVSAALPPGAFDSAIIAALGGASNIAAQQPSAGRSIFTLVDVAALDIAALDRAANGRWVRTPAGRLHILDA